MKILNLGGATAVLEHRDRRMLFDPWLDDGIFHGSWFHWPPAAATVETLGRVDYVYISHIHEDHCSAGTIQYLNRDAEVIIMDRKPNFVLSFLKSHGFDFRRVHLVPPRKGMQIAPDIHVDMIEADPANEMSYLIDSQLVVRWDGTTVFNANDCQPHESGLSYLKMHYPDIDLALLPYSGGSGYPGCYSNLSNEQKTAECDRILAARVAAFVSAAGAIGARWVMPFADQYVVGGSRRHLNRFVSHAASAGVVRDPMLRAGLADRLVLLNSGQRFDLQTGAHAPDEPYRMHSESDRDDYADRELAGALYDHEKVSFSPAVPADRLLAHARARLWQQQARRETFPDWRLVLDWVTSRRRFVIDLRHEVVGQVQSLSPCAPEIPMEAPFLRIAADDTLMVMLLLGHVSWNIADAALFLDYERQPNVYDPSLYVLLNFLRI
jgi:UDP-MurNAc hydroxylase